MNHRIIASTLLAAALGAVHLAAADPLLHACHSGLFKRTDKDPRELPLPPVQRLQQLVNSNSFKVRDIRNGEEFDLPVYGALPGDQPTGLKAPDLKALGEDIGADGATLVAPVDLTGSGVSDLIYARKDWGGWKVLSNGARMPKPFQGFVAGMYGKGQDTSRSDSIPADTRDMVVDNDLLAVVGDFLGNGTEQLAYTRPGWGQIWVVGAHGVTQMAADLSGIEGGGPGARVHWLFPFRSKGAHRTRLAYYRMGCAELPTFAPRGMAFKRDRVPLRGNWEKLSQNMLDWPQKAPSALEAKAEEAKGAVAKAIGQD